MELLLSITRELTGNSNLFQLTQIKFAGKSAVHSWKSENNDTIRSYQWMQAALIASLMKYIAKYLKNIFFKNKYKIKQKN